MTAASLALLLSVTVTAQLGPARKAPDASTLLRQAIELHEAGDNSGHPGLRELASLEPDNRRPLEPGAALARLAATRTRFPTTQAPSPPAWGRRLRVNLALAYYKSGRRGSRPPLEQALRSRQHPQGPASSWATATCSPAASRTRRSSGAWQRELGNDRAFALPGSALLETTVRTGPNRHRPDFRFRESAEGHSLRLPPTCARATTLLRSPSWEGGELNPSLPLVSPAGSGVAANRGSGAALGAFSASSRSIRTISGQFGARGPEEARTGLREAEPTCVGHCDAPARRGARFSLAGCTCPRARPTRRAPSWRRSSPITPPSPRPTCSWRLSTTASSVGGRDRMRARVEALNAEAQAREPAWP